jgi:hypothetical protein
MKLLEENMGRLLQIIVTDKIFFGENHKSKNRYI